MKYNEAIEILKNGGFKIKRGCIILDKDETDEQTKAINYLCDEWDFCAMSPESIIESGISL